MGHNYIARNLLPKGASAERKYQKAKKAARIWKEGCKGADEGQGTKEKHFTGADTGVVLIGWWETLLWTWQENKLVLLGRQFDSLLRFETFLLSEPIILYKAALFIVVKSWQ